MRFQGLKDPMVSKKEGFTDGQVCDDGVGLFLCEPRRKYPPDALLGVCKTQIRGSGPDVPLELPPFFAGEIKARP